MILAGDVGGTKVHLALYDFIEGKLSYTRDKQYPAKEYSGLEEIVKQFLGAEKVTAACFGVPGPVRDPRLSPAGNRLARQLGLLLEGLDWSRVRPTPVTAPLLAG